MKHKLKKHIGKKHNDIQKPELLRDEKIDKSLDMSIVSEERSIISLSPYDSIVEINQEESPRALGTYDCFRRVWILPVQTSCQI